MSDIGKICMMRFTRSAVLAVALVLLVACVGCNNQKDFSVTERVLEQYRKLPLEERDPALRKLALEDSLNAKYAFFELGNLFYDQARESTLPPGDGSLSGTNALLDSTLTYYQFAVDRDSTFIEPLVNMGLVWDNMADGRSAAARTAMGTAMDLYERAIAINPADEKARCNLGSLLLRRQDRAGAIDQFRAVLVEDPKSALAHYHLASMFAESRIYKEAIKEWELAVKYDSEGDIRERSQENIRIIHELLNSDIPESVTNH